jgi:hypothetical protein
MSPKRRRHPPAGDIAGTGVDDAGYSNKTTTNYSTISGGGGGGEAFGVDASVTGGRLSYAS